MTSIENSFTILSSVDSTNNYAMARVHEGLAKHGDAFFAVEQTAGKGQRGKNWQAAEGQNIVLSVVAEPFQLKTHQQFSFSIAVALACYDFFNGYAGDETKIKWPNDIYWRDRKAGGVLIENINRGNSWNWSVIGVGVNVNQTVFEASLKNPVSLRQITGKEHNVIALAKELQASIIRRLEELHSSGVSTLLTEYNQHLFRMNELVKLRKDNLVYETKIMGVNVEGKLLTRDAFDREIGFESVEWVL
ncbi:biotin--[acetyl-CoA-carboxylase] ligase [Ferruginibacter sp. SUN002]|uniref:biotin--[acetyl-CoA-carboxylase] ligase n=1 Tax=Ferruginibacter sp. SUN002 TaxID=2937789 RepID=UPI003D35BD27